MKRVIIAENMNGRLAFLDAAFLALTSPTETKRFWCREEFVGTFPAASLTDAWRLFVVGVRHLVRGRTYVEIKDNRIEFL